MPKSIQLFERLMFVVVGLGLLSFISQHQMWAGVNPLFVILPLLIGFGVTIGLTLLISRKRSNIARWIAIGMYIIGALYAVYNLITTGTLTGFSPVEGLPRIIAIVQMIVQGYATYLLFMPDSKAWTEKTPIPAAQDPGRV